MINLNNIKAILKLAGVSRLEIDFDNENECVNVVYIFKGTLGARKITYLEIINSLTIGQPEDPVGSGAAVAQELR